MSEIQTPHEDTSPLIEEAFQDDFEKYVNDSSRKFVHDDINAQPEAVESSDQDKEEVTEENTQTPRPNYRRRRTVAGAGLALVAGAAIGTPAVIAANASHVPEFSSDTTEYTVQPGDGLYDIAESIPGNNKDDPRNIIDHIAGDPANIDVLKDGLQPGEQVVVPKSIFGGENSNDK